MTLNDSLSADAILRSADQFGKTDSPENCCVTNSPELTILNLYDLKGTPEAFQTAVERLVKRMEAEGDPGVLAYKFFVNEAAESARAVIDYANSEGWIGHHDIAMAWPEMKAMHHVAYLREVVFLGSFTPEIRAWQYVGRRLLYQPCPLQKQSGHRFADLYCRVGAGT